MQIEFHLSDQEIREWTQKRRPARIPFEAEKSALLIVDMQNYFCDIKAPAFLDNTPYVIRHLFPLAEAYQRENLPLIFTRHIDSEDPSDIMNRWWKGRIDRNSRWSQIHRAFTELEQSAVTIDKNRYDAFHETNLRKILRQNGVEQIVIGGVMTHLCCETTARTAFNLGFPVFFLVDGTCTADRNHHEASLTNLAHGFATLVTTEFVRNRID